MPEDLRGEVTLLGTGGGYGESIVIHMGNGSWVVIDSCHDPNTKQALPLTYLKEIGINTALQVKLIVCTHWHDDHTQGLSILLEQCPSADFCFAHTTDKDKFLKMISYDRGKELLEPKNASAIQFNKCLDIIKARGQRLIRASADRNIFSVPINATLKSELHSLSPSDYTMEQFDKEISSLLVEFGPLSKKIPSKSPNAKSVAVLLKLGVHKVILGADLEISENENEGWLNILNRSTSLTSVSNVSLFKIPHHGSKTGYCEKIWIDKCNEDVIGTLTPWNKHRKLPQKDMLNTYHSKTKMLYITSTAKNEGPKIRHHKIEKKLKECSPNVKLTERKFRRGIVKATISLTDSEAIWTVELIDEARLVNDHYLKTAV